VPEGTCGPSEPQHLVLTADADAHVDASDPGTNFGSASQLYVDLSPAVLRTLLRFNVPTLTAELQTATLRLFATNPTPNGPKVYLTGLDWTEDGVTWDSQPSPIGIAVADVGTVSTGWIEVDVTGSVSGSGEIAFLLLPDSTDGADFDSREGTHAPELVVVTGTESDPDLCPNDPDKTEPGRCGCNVPESDCAGLAVACALNPYAAVDWSTWRQYRANFHTHTTRSDGQQEPHEVIDEYHDAGYSILAITDHNRITWPWTDYGRDPAALDMLAVRGDEYSSTNHVNAFHDFTTGRAGLEDGLPHIEANGGLAQINHPGRYSSPSDWDWYTYLYRTYPSCVGMEVINQSDRYSSDRRLWDNINESLFDSDRMLVWGYANDDKHSKRHLKAKSPARPTSATSPGGQVTLWCRASMISRSTTRPRLSRSPRAATIPLIGSGQGP
jgi:hypothetical protein